MNDIPLGALVGALFALLFISAFFSISETCMMAANRYRLKHLANKGHRGAKLALALLSKPDKLLGVILLGNTLANIASATLVTLVTIRLFGSGELAPFIATLLLTFVVLVFCELAPKVIAAAYPTRTALVLSFLLTPLLKGFYPVVWFLNIFVNGALKVLRFRTPTEGHSHQLSLEELRMLVLESAHFVQKKHQSILVNLFDLESITVDDVMTPRNQIEAIDINGTPEEMRQQLATCFHTRLPVYRERIEEIIGMVHVRKVLHLPQDKLITSGNLQQSMKEAYFVPSGTPLLSQLQNFQEKQECMGLVVDEYGELMGLITLDDILEEIIGEFFTQAPTPGGFVKQVDGSVLVEGSILLRDLNRKLGLKFPIEGPKTLNGLILEHFQDIPEPGTSVKIAGHPMEIVQTQDRIVKAVRIFPAVESA